MIRDPCPCPQTSLSPRSQICCKQQKWSALALAARSTAQGQSSAAPVPQEERAYSCLCICCPLFVGAALSGAPGLKDVRAACPLSSQSYSLLGQTGGLDLYRIVDRTYPLQNYLSQIHRSHERRLPVKRFGTQSGRVVPQYLHAITACYPCESQERMELGVNLRTAVCAEP